MCGLVFFFRNLGNYKKKNCYHKPTNVKGIFGLVSLITYNQSSLFANSPAHQNSTVTPKSILSVLFPGLTDLCMCRAAKCWATHGTRSQLRLNKAMTCFLCFRVSRYKQVSFCKLLGATFSEFLCCLLVTPLFTVTPSIMRWNAVFLSTRL